MQRLVVDQTSADEFTKRILDAVEEATAPLCRKVDELQEELRKARRVLTPKSAIHYFDYAVKPERIVEFIRGKNLPQNAVVPLPANKIGNTYYIEAQTLQRWQLGQCTEDDLFPWQRACRTSRPKH